MKNTLFLITLFILLLPGVSFCANRYSFYELNIIFQKKLLHKELSTINKEFHNGESGLSVAGFMLRNKIKDGEKIEYSFKDNCDRRAIRLTLDGEKIIRAIAVYLYDNNIGGFVSDYDLSKYNYGEPIMTIQEPRPGIGFIVFDTKAAYLMMGYYNKEIYYAALFDKEFVK